MVFLLSNSFFVCCKNKDCSTNFLFSVFFITFISKEIVLTNNGTTQQKKHMNLSIKSCIFLYDFSDFGNNVSNPKI